MYLIKTPKFTQTFGVYESRVLILKLFYQEDVPMQPSIELKNLVLQHYEIEAAPGGPLEVARTDYSHQDGVLFIGTDPGEWFEGYAAIVRYIEAAGGGGLKARVDFLEAWSEGLVGWAVDRVFVKLPDGIELPFRHTRIFQKEGEAWKIVHTHVSTPIPDEMLIHLHQKSTADATETNKAIVRRFFEEAFNQRNLALVDEFVAPEYINRNPSIQIAGPAGVKRALTAQFETFPDIHTTIEDIVAEGDRVVVRMLDRYTQPDGTQDSLSWIEILRLKDGKFIEAWFEADTKPLRDMLLKKE